MLSVDAVQDVAVRKTFYDIVGKDGVSRRIDMGGRVVSMDGGLIYVLFSHDESCFHSGELPTHSDVRMRGGAALTACMRV